MNIIEYFDVHNEEHIKAFAHLRKTGNLPYDFCSVAIEVVDGWPAYWVETVTAKFADAYCEQFSNTTETE